GEEFDLLLRTGGALEIVEAARLLECVAKVLEPALVRRPGRRIEELASVTGRRVPAALLRSVRPAREVQHVELAAGMAQQGLEEGEALRVLQLEVVRSVDDGPVFDVLTHDGLRARRAVAGVGGLAVASLVRRGDPRRGRRERHQLVAKPAHAASFSELEGRSP